ncbi:DUF2752 domain-containing protein [candidate division KSB1 bacterium]|nr:DUF2752 domain-containing protein [candidate division KSB1 bacterium]
MMFQPGHGISRENYLQSLRLLIGVNLLMIALIGILSLFPINQVRFYPPCPWYFLTKTYCPGCGTLRGISDLIHFNFMGLVRQNLLAALMLPFLGYSYLNLWVNVLLRYRLPSIFFSQNEILIIVAGIIFWGITRNFIPLLAPKILP